MQRAKETAAIVAQTLNVSVQFVPELREWNGHLAVERLEPGEEWPRFQGPPSALMDWRPFPSGESWREFYSRVGRRMTQLAAEQGVDELPILVAHGGSVSNVVGWWLGLPLDALPDRSPFKTTPGALSLLRRNKYNKPEVAVLNDRMHLYIAGLDSGHWI